MKMEGPNLFMLAWAQQHPNLLSLAWDHQAYLHLFVLSLLLIYPPHSQRSLQASPPSINQLAAVLYCQENAKPKNR
jgi:hypothetical protein